MLFAGIVGDGTSQNAACALIDVQGEGQIYRLYGHEAAAPGPLAALLGALRQQSGLHEAGARAQLTVAQPLTIELLAGLHLQIGEWLGSVMRETLQAAGCAPQAVELAGCAGMLLDGGLALGNHAEAARASGLLCISVAAPNPNLPLARRADECARAAWEQWRRARQPGVEKAVSMQGTHPLTEGRNPATAEIDSLPTLDMLRLINIEDTRVARAVGSQLTAVASAVDQIAGRMRHGGRLIYAGAGTSGRIGVLDASEIPPTYGTPPELVVACIAGGDEAVRKSREGVEDDTRAGEVAMQELGVGPLDSLVGIAASGRTPYVIAAMEEARRRGALVVSLACSSPSPMEALADIVIAPVVGPEVITGSTRMKAGTAQKLVLNMLSTCVMVRLGKTFSNLMVDMQATNTKLRGRARRMVSELASIDEQAAARLLEQAGGELKTAIVMARTGLGADEARALLGRHGGVVRAAVEAGEEA